MTQRYGPSVPANPTTAATDSDGWVRVLVLISPDAVEVVSDILWTHGAAGIEEQDHEGQVLLLGGFSHRDAAAKAQLALAAAGVDGARVEAVTDDGLDGWRAWAQPELAGPFWITPTWVAAPVVGDGQRILWIDPEATFGSGSHPTTRLVLGLLADLVAPGDRVLDVGAGSGVLAVGAAVLDAREVMAIDIDPGSPNAVNANAARNGVAHLVTASTDSLGPQHRSFNVVAANLLAPVIAELGADLMSALAPGGTLVVSGLLADRWEATMTHLHPLQVAHTAELDGWVAVVLR